MANTKKYKAGDLPSQSAESITPQPEATTEPVQATETATATLEQPVQPTDDGFIKVINPDGTQPMTQPVTSEPLAAPGNPKLKGGHHKDLLERVYDVYGCELKLSGKVFIAGKDVNWVPVNKCGCGRERSAPTQFVVSLNGNGMSACIAFCDNKRTCKVEGTYVYIHKAGTMVMGS